MSDGTRTTWDLITVGSCKRDCGFEGGEVEAGFDPFMDRGSCSWECPDCGTYQTWEFDDVG